MKSLIKYFRSYNEDVMIPYKKWIGKHKIGYYVICPMLIIGMTYALYKCLTRNS